ncbi:ABC transporter permease, partial [Sinorhizobium medicae]
ALKVFLANPNALFGTAFLALVIAVALLAPVLYPDDPLSMVGKPFLWPGQDPAFPLGTDSLGRDVLAGILHGSRISLFVGLMATALSLTFGVFVGAIAGYFAGWVDDLLVRLIEIFQTLPSFVLLVVLV